MKACLLFPGQGAQYLGMFNTLSARYRYVKDILDESSEVLDFDLTQMVASGDMRSLTRSDNAQPAVVAASYALYTVLKQESELEPVCAVGHSLGEISALAAAGGIAFADALRFARRRGQIMHRACEEKIGRAALVLDCAHELLEFEAAAVRLDTGYVGISCYNAPQQFVVAGTAEAIRELDKRILHLGGELVPFSMMPMKTDAPYHSPLMQFIAAEMNAEIAKLQPSTLAWEVISTVDAQPIGAPERIASLLGIQLNSPVLWSAALQKAATREINVFVDVGPQSFIKNLVTDNLGDVSCIAFDPIPKHGDDHMELFQSALYNLSANIYKE